MAQDRLWSSSKAGQSAREYLHRRGFTNETINTAGLGVNQKDRWPTRNEWGLDGEGKVWLPSGVVIPWGDPGGTSNVNIRRPQGDVKPEAEDQWRRRKYQRAPGPSAPMYGVQWVSDPMPIVLVAVLEPIGVHFIGYQQGQIEGPTARAVTRKAEKSH